MIDQYAFQSSGGRFCPLLIFFGALIVAPLGLAEEALPFDPSQIYRLSVDNIPRSVSVRQGADIWFGYDLEKAIIFKAWKAPKDKPGVTIKGFTGASNGAILFEGKTAEGWQISVDGKSVPLTVRYLGCSQNKDHCELRWELSHPGGAIHLSERISTAPTDGSSSAHRELRVESLEPGVSLELPAAYRDAWLLDGAEGKPVKALTNPAWHQLSLR